MFQVPETQQPVVETNEELIITHKQITSLTGRTPGQIDNNVKKHVGFSDRAFCRHPELPAKWIVRPELASVLPEEVVATLRAGECLTQPIYVSTRSLGFLLKPAIQCGAMKSFNPNLMSHLKGATRMSFHDKEKNSTYNVFMIAPWRKSNINAWNAIGYVWSQRNKV